LLGFGGKGLSKLTWDLRGRAVAAGLSRVWRALEDGSAGWGLLGVGSELKGDEVQLDLVDYCFDDGTFDGTLEGASGNRRSVMTFELDGLADDLGLEDVVVGPLFRMLS
jgi:hypothetical protein